MDPKIIPAELRDLSDMDALRTLDSYLVSAMQLSALLRERLHDAHPSAFASSQSNPDARVSLSRLLMQFFIGENWCLFYGRIERTS